MDIYLFIGLYILLVIGLSYYYSRNASDEDYLISGRDRSDFNILASKFAGAVGVSTFITYTGYSYKFGALGVTPLILSAAVGYLIFAFWAAPIINRRSSEAQFYTQGDLVKHQTGNENTTLFTNGITIVIQFFWILLSLVGGAEVIAHFGILPYPIALVTTSAIILCYILLSGFKAVIITDVFQTIIIIILLGIIVYNILYGGLGNPQELFNTAPKEAIGLGDIIGLMLYGGLSVFGMADRYQLCYAAKDENTAKRGMGLALVPIIIVVSLLMFVGLSALAKDNGLPDDEAFLYAMKNLLSPDFYPVLLILFFAGLMSSADTNVFAVSSHLTFSIHTQDKVKTSRIITVIVLIAATSIAFFWTDIVDITIVGAAMRLTLAVPMIYIINKGNNAGRFMASASLAILALVVGLFVFGPSPRIVILVLVGSLLGLIYKQKALSNHQVMDNILDDKN